MGFDFIEAKIRKLEQNIEKISGEVYTPRFFSLAQLLVVISHGYKWVTRLRLLGYRLGIFVNAPCRCP